MTANTKPFSFQYAAHEQETDEQLRQRYHLAPDTDVSEELRHAPLREQKAALHISLILGLCDLLLFGAGLSVLLITQSVWKYPFGLLLGITGLGGMLLMPAIYRRISERKRQQTEQALLSAESIRKARTNP